MNADDFPELAHLGTKYVEEATVSKDFNFKTNGQEEENNFLSHEELAECLLNESKKHSLPARFRALFGLRNLADEKAIKIIGQGMCVCFFLKFKVKSVF